ncbi:ATP-binding protein [Parvicella tangerina]|uniref:Trifunctional NAD biosynthesis/regulator protein NadR n=1 Tax=Parvicella tangerina TaxID=2829795 RepID=A0A916NCK1_9FLAO|nr:ATP-binding protein [Parvicella tangerina]CAG5085396.1 Trifunctional NAD biosynthesis/regulator protein NadR [Parvicella tangerina]
MKTRRIAILGPESSGKTTLANSLSSHFGATLSEEFARSYLSINGKNYEFNDLEYIAIRQFESNSQPTDHAYLIADTEILTVKIWSEVKYDKVSPKVLSLLDQQKFDFYLLCKPDIPWEKDPLREHPKFRHELFQMYESALQKLKWPYCIIEGENRAEKALKFIGRIS